MKRSHLWAILLLMLFLGAKAMEFHPMGHTEDGASDRCELCDFALLVKTTPFAPSEQTKLESPVELSPVTAVSIPSTQILISQELEAGQFYRPPPSPPAV
jgi:hypothetical protein